VVLCVGMTAGMAVGVGVSDGSLSPESQTFSLEGGYIFFSEGSLASDKVLFSFPSVPQPGFACEVQLSRFDAGHLLREGREGNSPASLSSDRS
jgi:hypothetical protein